MLEPGTPAPDFTLRDTHGEEVALSSHRGKWVVFWWYPEANSSGCSLQAVSLERHLAEIKGEDAVVLGASFNTVEKNDEFSCDKSLSMPLLSDPDQVAGRAYDTVRDPDERFATKPRRYTYIIDPEGLVAHSENADAIELTQYGEHIVEVMTTLRQR